MRKEISGGLSAAEARAMLLKRGIEAFSRLAGMIPQMGENIANFDDLPFVFDGNWYEYAYDNALTLEHFGLVRGIRIKIHANICWNCHGKLRVYFLRLSPTMNFYQIVKRGYCSICGRYENDEIPF